MAEVVDAEVHTSTEEKAPTILDKDGHILTPEDMAKLAKERAETDAELAKQQAGNRTSRRNFSRLWRANQEGAGGINNTKHKYTRHKPTRKEIKARRKHGRR